MLASLLGVFRGRRGLLVVCIGIGIGGGGRGLAVPRRVEQFGEAAVVVLEEAEGAQGVDARGVLGGVGEFAGGEGVLVDGDGALGLAGRVARRAGVLVGLGATALGGVCIFCEGRRANLCER